MATPDAQHILRANASPLRTDAFGSCLRVWFVLCALTFATTPSLGAETPAFTFSEPGTGITTAGTDGFQFTPLIDVIVTSLGYYDRGQDGLAEMHPVTLFHTETGGEIAYAQITTDSVRRRNFRFQPIQPVLLRGGETYVLAAFTPGNSDPPADSPADLIIAPQIGYQGYLFDFGSSFRRPGRTDLFSERTFFGPNFEFHPAPALLSSAP